MTCPQGFGASVHPPLGPQTVAPGLAPRSQVPGSVPVTAVCPLASGTRRGLPRLPSNTPPPKARACDPAAGSWKPQVHRPFSSANRSCGQPPVPPHLLSLTPASPSPLRGAAPRAREGGSACVCSHRSASRREDACRTTLPSWGGLTSPGQGRTWAARLAPVQDPSRAEGRVISVNRKRTLKARSFQRSQSSERASDHWVFSTRVSYGPCH